MNVLDISGLCFIIAQNFIFIFVRPRLMSDRRRISKREYEGRQSEVSCRKYLTVAVSKQNITSHIVASLK